MDDPIGKINELVELTKSIRDLTRENPEMLYTTEIMESIKCIKETISLAEKDILSVDSLYRYTCASRYKSFDDIRDIVKNIRSDDVVILIEKYNRYMVFDSCSEYIKFLRNVFGMGDASEEELEKTSRDFVKYQIITLDKKQKVTLVCENNSVNTSNIKALIKSCFNAESHIVYNEKWDKQQIVIDIIIDNFGQNKAYYEKLSAFANTKGSCKIPKLDLPKPISDIDNDLNYITPKVSHMNLSSDILQSSLLSSKEPHKNIYINIKNKGNNITNNINIGNANDDVNISNMTTKWVSENLPKHKQSTTEYYNNYKKYMTNIGSMALSKQKFTPLVKKFGCEVGHDSKKNYWKWPG